MQVRGEKWAYFDVDGTLVEWLPENDERVQNLMHERLSIPLSGYCLIPLHGNIEKLLELKTKGWTIVVWSQGGFDWAEEVLNALGIREMADFVLTKPHMIIDDLPSSIWMPSEHFFIASLTHE